MEKKVKIYLDIDETILNNTVETTDKGTYLKSYPAKHLKEFLTHVLNNHDVYWLTTHCNGDASDPVLFLSKHFDQDLMDLVIKIKPTRWNKRKIEALNLEDDFLWFDDVLLSSEEKEFKEADKLDSFVLVNLDKNPDFWLDWTDF
ncbi:hypothetical protein ACFLZK_00085 [Patescibacteria group bacterium]